jgi:hypothetical protein
VFQLQQAAAAKGGAGAEALAPPADRGERKDGQVAVHAAVRGARLRNKEAAGRGKKLDFCACMIKDARTPSVARTRALTAH